MFLMILTSDHVSPATGKTVTVNLSKAGGAFSAAAGAITEVANGWYYIALTVADTNTAGDLVFNCTASGCDNTDFDDQVTPQDIGQHRVAKNIALANFMFLMVGSSDHVTGKTGLTITATRSIDGSAFQACANAASEIANGIYKINLAASDLNGDVISFQFSAIGADSRFFTIVTQP